MSRFSARHPAECMTLHLFLLLSLLPMWFGEAAASGREPGEQLVRMADALRSLSYEGTIVYLHGTRLEALRITHRVENGQTRERLVSLNGPVRTLTREKGSVTCELSNSRPISVKGHGVRKDVLHAWTLNPEKLSDHYGVHPLGTARVAGRQTEVVGVIPRDRLRYGYRFYLDVESGLPLKSDLMGQQPDPIEQIMFTSLDLLPAEGPAVEVGPVPQPRRSEPADLDLDSLPWRFDSLPPGFLLMMYDNLRDADGQPVDHFVLSDGLASMSVYIERDPKEGLEGDTRIGAVHAAGKRISGYQVTVVGEVPRETVQTVLASVRHLPGAQR
ncbi:MAG: MucB/RseB C-terminal domain-containing protein [Chromatiaceae bacterium]|nr:MucB/RseB C-terminal domain-containing protein [Chromatiaceae bacterium]